MPKYFSFWGQRVGMWDFTDCAPDCSSQLSKKDTAGYLVVKLWCDRQQLLRYHLDNVGAGGVDAGDDVHADDHLSLVSGKKQKAQEVNRECREVKDGLLGVNKINPDIRQAKQKKSIRKVSFFIFFTYIGFRYILYLLFQLFF